MSPVLEPLPAPPSVSKTTILMAGLLVDAYGVDELSSPRPATHITCLWLHHPRNKAKEHMGDFAARAVAAWNERREEAAPERGLVALAFDQRNHGSRLVDEKANESWRAGNERHAVDMMGAVSGMVADTKGLMDVVEGYLGVEGAVVDGHFALGVSLGGHSTWQMMFSDERVTAGVVIIGCPDYMALMSDRARRSKLDTWNPEDGGKSFLGSRHFPRDLVALCHRVDPKGLLFGTELIPESLDERQRAKLGAILDRRVKGKKFLLCSGADDRLVPYRASKAFNEFFVDAVQGWYKGGDVAVENKVYEGVGHEFSVEMVRDALRFFVDALEERSKEDRPKI